MTDDEIDKLLQDDRHAREQGLSSDLVDVLVAEVKFLRGARDEWREMAHSREKLAEDTRATLVREREATASVTIEGDAATVHAVQIPVPPEVVKEVLVAALLEDNKHLAAERDALVQRRDELLATVARLSRETPYPDELKGWEQQRSAMIAEVGTLKAKVVELTAECDALRRDKEKK